MIIYNYITTNLKNGKQYIGMHSLKNVNDNYMGTGKLLLRAFKKYGKENFKCDILCYCDSIGEANFNEMIFIEQYHTLYPKGYNLSPTGGLGYSGCHSDKIRQKMIGNKNAVGTIPSKETREKIRLTKIGNKWGFQKGHKLNEGKKATIETRMKMSEIRKGEKGGFYSKHHSVETIEKMSKARIGRDVYWLKGVPKSEEVKKKIRETKKFNPYKSTWLGKKHSEETRKKMSESAINRHKHHKAA